MRPGFSIYFYCTVPPLSILSCFFNAVKKDGIDFVYIKATEGIDFTDPMFQHNVKGAREEGIYIG
ncbi:GH25 family lysozyme, partial [Aneurinibacillus aneurinilyticus]|uniref:GH25 family lysozyme n=1 Tax=Aneurinibacillus aneurinilyticus TaxID=1391 RepID=UPI0035233F1D